MKRHRRRLRVWAAPAAVAASSLLGLLAALVGDGFWDAVSWLALGAPVLVVWRFAWPGCFHKPRGGRGLSGRYRQDEGS